MGYEHKDNGLFRCRGCKRTMCELGYAHNNAFENWNGFNMSQQNNNNQNRNDNEGGDGIDEDGRNNQNGENEDEMNMN